MLQACAAPAIWPDPDDLRELAPQTAIEHSMADVGVILQDGEVGPRYLFKWGKEDGLAEEAAWLLAERLDLNVPAAKAGKHGKAHGALMRVVEGARALPDPDEYGKFPDRWYCELVGQSVLDYVLCDNDRHDANYLLSRGSLVAIDHAYALRDEGAEPRSVSEYIGKTEEWSVIGAVIRDFPEALLCAIRPAQVRRHLDHLMAIPETQFRAWVRRGASECGRDRVVKEAVSRRRVARAEFGQLFTEIIDKSRVVPLAWARWRSLPAFG